MRSCDERWRSFSLEHGCALFHERPSTFDVVFALHAAANRCFGAREMTLRFCQGIDDRLGRSHSQWRITCQFGDCFCHVSVELAIRQHAIDQADSERFLCVITARTEHDLARVRMADRGDQPAGAMDAITQSEPRGRNREATGGIRVAQVARQRDRQSTADTKTMDQRDYRFRHGLDSVMRSRSYGFVFLHVAFACAVAFEFRDVCSGGKRGRSFAADHDATNRRVRLELRDGYWYRP